MPARREYTKETVEIMARFFNAVDALILQSRIRGIKTYCDKAGINRRHYYAQKTLLSRGYFEMSWMLPLMSEFGVSSNWLLFGKGNMFSVKVEQKQTASVS